MSTRTKRTAGRFQVEALEGRLAPGGQPGGVLRDSMTCHIGEEIPQVHVAQATCGSNTIRAGEEGNATPVACGSKPGIMSGSNSILYGQETNANPVACGSKPGIASGSN